MAATLNITDTSKVAMCIRDVDGVIQVREKLMELRPIKGTQQVVISLWG